MTVRAIALILASALTLFVTSLAHAQAAADTQLCTSGRWLPPRPLRTHDGYTIIAARTSVLPFEGKTLLATWPLRTSDSVGHIVYPLAPGLTAPIAPEQLAMGALADSDGVSRLIPAPHELAVYAMHFEASRDEAGVVHALFGSDDSMPVTSMIALRSLWYTHLEGQRWTVPERILTTDGKVMFAPAMRSPIVTRGRTLHAVVAMEGEGLRYLRRERDDWTNRHIDIPPTMMGFPRLAAIRTGRLALIVQAGREHPRTSSMSSVDVSWSDDDGAHWTRPRRISDSTEEPVYDLQLFADERDVLYAFWFQQTDSTGNPALHVALGGSPGRIHAAQSTDGGVSWRHSPPSTLLANATDLQLLLLPHHTALAVTADLRDERIVSLTWSGRWSQPELIDAKPQPFNPSLGLGGAQRPVLVWGITRRPDWTISMMATYVPCR